MNMYNLDLNEQMLETLITQLENDNLIIVDSINKIYEIMTKIEKKDWNSPEKIDIDNNFIPYINAESQYFKNNFEEKINLLKFALKSYREQNQQLIKEADDLEVL